MYAEFLVDEVVDLIKFVAKEEERWDFIDPLEIKDTSDKELTYSNPFDLFDFLQDNVRPKSFKNL